MINPRFSPLPPWERVGPSSPIGRRLDGERGTKRLSKYFQYLSTALLLCLLITSCNTTRRTSFRGPIVTQKISHHQAAEKPTAVTLMLHGLNVNPDRMESLTRLCESMGQDVFVLRLTGHRGDTKAFKSVTRNIWHSDIREAYDRAKSRADALGVPFYFVGYSLGGLLTLDFLANSKRIDNGFDRMVLFAPALSLNWYAHAIKSAFVLSDGVFIPTFAPQDYSANKKIPVAAFRSLFDSFDHLHRADFKQLNIPTLLFVSHKDELVSARGIRRLVEDKKLTKWEIIPVDTTQSTRREKYNHIIIEEAAVGKNEWAKIKGGVQRFLKTPDQIL